MQQNILLLRNEWAVNLYPLGNLFTIYDASQFQTLIDAEFEDLSCRAIKREGEIPEANVSLQSLLNLEKGLILKVKGTNISGRIILQSAYGEVWGGSEIHTMLLPQDHPSKAGLRFYSKEKELVIPHPRLGR